MAKGGGHEKGHGGGGHSGGGGGHGGGKSAEKAKAAVASALSGAEIAAWNFLPPLAASREAMRMLVGQSVSVKTAFYGGLFAAFMFSFGKEMLSGVLGKLGGGH